MNIDNTINEAVNSVNLKDESTVAAAAARILEGGAAKAGAKVAVIDDPTWAMSGLRGTSKGVSSKGSGFVDVEFENGTTVPCLANQLITL